MKIFEPESPNPLTNISGSNLLKIKMNTPFPPIVSVSITSNAEEISMDINQEIFESKFVDQTITSIEIIFISIQTTFTSVQIISILAETTFIPNSFTSINSKKTKLLFPKEKRPNNNIKPIKKQKSNESDEILLFIPELNQQKVKQTMHQAKIALSSAYAFSENANILITIDLINQIMKGKSKMFEKIQFSNIHVKLNRILKKFDDSKKSIFTIESNAEKKKKTVKSFISKIKPEPFILPPQIFKKVNLMNLALSLKPQSSKT